MNPPQNWQEFENGSAALWAVDLRDIGFKRFGRGGQEQFGLDITGYKNGDPETLVGVQCKCIDRNKKLSKDTVLEEVDKVLASGIDVREYYLTHTGPDDAKLDALATQLTQELKTRGRHMLIRVWGWGTLQEKITKHPQVINEFDPGWSPFGNRIEEALSDQAGALAEQGQTLSEIHAMMSTLVARGTAGFSPVDAPAAGTSAVDAVWDKMIDRCRDMADDGRPGQALSLLSSVWDDLDDKASNRIRFRVKANIGSCHLKLGDRAQAAEELVAAFDLWPDDVKSVTNKVLGLLLREDFDAALNLARESLDHFPDSDTLGAYMIHALSHDCAVDDPREMLPERLRRTEHVWIAYIDYLWSRERRPDWWEAAKSAVEDFPESEELRVNAANAVVDRLARKHNDRETLDPSERSELEAASLVLEKQYETVMAHECPTRDDHVSQVLNYIVSVTALGDMQAAKGVIRRWLDIQPDNRHLLVMAGRLGFEAGDNELEDIAFERLSNDDGEGLLLKSQIAARHGNWTFLRGITAEQAGKIPETERTTVAALLATAKTKAETPSKAVATAAALVKSTSGEPRPSILAAGLARDLALPDLERTAFENAVAAVTAESHFSSRSMVASYAMGKDAYGTVIRLLDGHVATNEDSEELRMLATAYAYAVPSRKGGNVFFASLSDALRTGERYRFLKGVYHFNEGDIASAEIELREAHSAAPTDCRLIFAVFQTLSRRPDYEAAITEFLKTIDTQNLVGTAVDKLTIARALQAADRTDDGIVLAYDAFQLGRNDPAAHLQYAFLVFESVKRSPLLESPARVEIGCWVELANSAGETFSFLIEDKDEQPAERIFGPSHTYSRETLGKRVGDEICIPHALEVRTWRVNEIKSRYLHVFHDVIEHFNARFPDHRGFWKMTMKDGDPSAVFDFTRKQAEHRDRVLDTYQRNLLPLQVVAGGGGRVISLVETLRHSSHSIKTCHGAGAERQAALQAIGDMRQNGVVLDTFTFWSVVGLGALDVLKDVFGRVMVTRSTADEIAAMKREHLSSRERRTGTTAFLDGQFYFHEFTEEDWFARDRLFAERDEALSEIDIVSVHLEDDLDPDVEIAIQDMGVDLVAPALAAREHRAFLLSDDLAFRLLAMDCFGVRTGWLQAVLMYARFTGKLEMTRYAELIADLARMKHGYVSIEAAALIALVPEDGPIQHSRFDFLTDFIGTETADMRSHISVTAEFLRTIWTAGSISVRTMAATGLIVEKLLRHRRDDWRAVLSVLPAEVGNQRFDDYLQRWRRGHFLPSGEPRRLS